jgi:hypothetical protein
VHCARWFYQDSPNQFWDQCTSIKLISGRNFHKGLLLNKLFLDK